MCKMGCYKLKNTDNMSGQNTSNKNLHNNDTRRKVKEEGVGDIGRGRYVWKKKALESELK